MMMMMVMETSGDHPRCRGWDRQADMLTYKTTCKRNLTLSVRLGSGGGGYVNIMAIQ